MLENNQGLFNQITPSNVHPYKVFKFHPTVINFAYRTVIEAPRVSYNKRWRVLTLRSKYHNKILKKYFKNNVYEGR